MSKADTIAEGRAGFRRSAFCMLITVVLLCVSQTGFCQTNITPDGSLGTTVNQAGNVFDINGGKIMGANQFQSFDKFSLGSGDIASFNGPAGIENILSRVTGGELSNINGTLRSTINGANLYFFNPSGVVLGPDAKLDVSGSFHVSTADFIQFADGARFFADLSRDSVLSAAAPEAFGFLSANPASLSLEGSSLKVPAGRTLSVIGGNVEMRGGSLEALGSRINLASAASPGEVIPTATDLEVTSERQGRMQISEGARIDVSGDPSAGGAGGTVVIRAGELTVSGVPESFEPTIVSNTSGPQHGAQTGIDVQVSGEMSLTAGAELRSAASPFSTGDAGDIVLDVGRLTVTDAALINSSTSFFASGNAGDIIVNAKDEVSVIDAKITSQTAFGTGNGGRISITAPEVDLQGGFNATLSSSTSGGGFLGGKGGDIILHVGRLTVGADAGIDSTTENSLGDAGSITIFASEEVTLSSPDEMLSPVIRTGNLTGPGNAGNIVIETPQLTVTSGGAITSTTDGAGRGGSIIVGTPDGKNSPTRKVVISGAGSGLFTGTTAEGAGGTIEVSAQKLILLDEGTISARATGTGDAGNLTIETGSFKSQNSSLTTESAASNGGNIQVTARSVVDLFKSEITAAAMGDAQSGSDGGNVAIEADNIALNGSAVRANAFGGDGGNIDISAKVYLASEESPMSIVDASSALGIDGEVNVDAGVRVLSGTLAPLPDIVFAGTDLIRDACRARYRKGQRSSFIVKGRDRVPPQPGDFLPSPYARQERSTGGSGADPMDSPEGRWNAIADISLREFFLEGKCSGHDGRTFGRALFSRDKDS